MFCCSLTSLMDWLPSGLILKDPVWIIFFGSTWEMAHSISSTRALQAAGSTEDTRQDFFPSNVTHNVLIRGRRNKHIPPHLMSCPCLAAWLKLRRRHTSTLDASRSAASLILHLKKAQISPQHRLKHRPLQQQTLRRRTRELAGNVSATQLATFMSDRYNSEQRLTHGNTRFDNFSFNLQVSGSASRDHLTLRFSTLFHRIR